MNKEDALRFEMIKAAADRTEQRELGKKEGKQEQLKKNIKTMASKGCKSEEIANLLDVDLSYIKEVLEKQ